MNLAFKVLLENDRECYKILDLDPSWLDQLESYVIWLAYKQKNFVSVMETWAKMPEIESRHHALKHFKNAWDKITNKVDAKHELHHAAQSFNNAWGPGQSAQGPKHSFGLNVNDDRDGFIVRWLQGIETFTRGHQVVLDLLLQKVFCADKNSYHANPMRAWLYDNFGQRVDSLVSYGTWVTTDPNKFKTEPIDYCKGLTRSVCTPILLSTGGSGVVMWLTVDLFEDGLGSLAPDIFSLGLSQINGGGASSNTNSPTEDPSKDQDDVSLLQSFDAMWALSRLGELGFSGRWRITNRPTTQCAALHLEEGHVSNLPQLVNYTGRSAECAMLVSLLAASGFVYEPIPKSQPPVLPPRVFLNTFFAATATVCSSKQNADDIRSRLLGRVYEVDCKLGACTRYKLEPSEDSESPLIDTIVISVGDYDVQKSLPTSQVFQAIQREQDEKKSKHTKHAGVRGVHFQSCATVQKALDWMLAVNDWSRLRKQAQRAKWESQWDVVRNENGEPISHELKDDGSHVVLTDDKKDQWVCTGSLEYMRNPFGGAKRTTPVVEQGQETPAADGDEPVQRVE